VRESVSVVVEICAAVLGVGFSTWLFVTRHRRADKVRERLQSLPRRLGETDAPNAAPRVVAGVAVAGLLISAWVLVDGVRGLPQIS
jgi:hypothetical protein